MAASREQIRGEGVFQNITPFLQQRHVPGKGRRVAGHIDDAPGREAVQGLDGVGVEALPGRIHDDHVGFYALALQFQCRRACVAAEKFRVFNAVALGVVFRILHRLGDHLHADDLSGGGGHGQGDGANAAVEVQNGVVLGDLRLLDGGLIEPLGLMVVHLIEGPGGQPEGKAAEGVLNIARAVEGEEFVSQHRVALPGVDGQHQGSEAGNLLKAADQLLRTGDLPAVDDKTHQNLPGDSAPADIDMPQQTLMGHFIIGSHPVLVYIIYDRILDPVRFLRQDQAAVIFHHIMGSGPEESCVGTVFLRCHGVLGLVPVAAAGGGGEDLHLVQILTADPVQAGAHPLGLQPGFLLVVHVPEIAAAAELGNRALPVAAVGGFFQDLHDLSCCPGLSGVFNADPVLFPGDGIGDKDRAALDMGNALTLGGVIGNDRFINCVFCQHNSISMVMFRGFSPDFS